jgi:hypothetical protein
MSATDVKSNGYSANVHMELCVNGLTFRIGQLGPAFLILDEPTDLPPARGEITVSIDGQVRRWQVQLPEGVSITRQICAIQSWQD